MTLLLLAYLGGVRTIISPCILPVLPFVFARSDRRFIGSGLPILVGMAATFAAVATLAAVGGGWAVQVNEYGRYAAIALLALFGVTLLFPVLSDRLTRPLVALGARLSEAVDQQGQTSGAVVFSSLVLGVATGLLWAPCAGPDPNRRSAQRRERPDDVAAGRLCRRCGDVAGPRTADRRSRVRRNETLARRRRMDKARPGRCGACRRRGDRARARHPVPDAGVARQHGASRTATGRQAAPRSARGSGQVAMTVPAPPAAPQASAPDPASALAVEGELPSLSGAVQWLNSPQLTPEVLRGKIVVVDFWTYSCINCLRAIPYVRAWYEKYKDQGLVVIGVHTPEFAFEKNVHNVKKAVSDLKIDFPVAIDSDYAIWRAFRNMYWPADYFIDGQGRIRDHAFGEGDYRLSERTIQLLLQEAGRANVSGGFVGVTALGAQAAPDNDDNRSPETYVGYGRAENFISRGGAVKDTAHVYAVARPQLNQWGLSGDWTGGKERAVLNRQDGGIAYRFHARDLHLVLGSGSGQPIRFKVTIDGKPPGDSHGVDVDAEGRGVVTGQRLYQLIRQSGTIGDHTFEIRFLDPGVEAYAFTFG